jgi:DNA-binding NtrC family response regulator
VRLVTATNRDLQKEVAAGAFREDLFYRLNVVPVHLPPLRERTVDIPLLVEHFIARFNERLKKQIAGIDEEGLTRLMAHPWPGNIRELENVLERTILFCEGPKIRASDLPPEISGGSGPTVLPPPAPSLMPPALPPPPAAAPSPASSSGRASSLKEIVRQETERVERELIMRALEETGGNVTQAARKLKISRKSLQNKMKEFGLRDRE